MTNALIHGRAQRCCGWDAARPGHRDRDRDWARPHRPPCRALPPHPLIDPGPGPGPRLGLWLSHQLVDVAHRHGPDGYTIRLAATPPLDHTD